MATPAFSEEIKRKIYPGWTDEASMRADWREQGEKKWASYQGSLGPSVTSLGTSAADRTAFFGKQKGEEEEFLGRFRTEFPELLTGIEEELGLPGLRGRAQSLTGLFEETPERVEVGARGFDVTANQLARMIAAESGELAPEVSKAISQAQYGEEEFGRRAQRELVPFQTEAQFLTDRLSREATGFGIEQQGRLDMLLQKLQNEGNLDIAEMQEATKLSQLEQSKTEYEEGITTIDLGDRVGFFDRFGNLIKSEPKGATPTSGGGGTSFVTTSPAGGPTSIGPGAGVELQTLWDFSEGTTGGSGTLNF